MITWNNLRLLFSLTKPRIFIAISITALMGLLLQENANYSFAIWFSVFLSTALSSAGSAVLNHYYERETDQLMERTKNRPLAVGAIQPPQLANYFGWGMIGVGVSLAYGIQGWLSALLLATGALIYVIVYTLWIKHTSVWNVTIGGASASFAILAGNTAISGEINLGGIIFSIFLFFWNPAHFWNLAIYLKDDYARANIPMLPELVGIKNTLYITFAHAVVMVGVSLILAKYSSLDWLYLSIAGISGTFFIGMNIQNILQTTKKRCLRNFIFSNLYLILISIGMSLDIIFLER
ncbi:MAG: protoheme IX farnesyltransferase [bacterium]|jgi:protoheme IX farnesyltransferase